MASTQSAKHTTGLAGEFFVAAELLRRGLLASITYGNAKKADVVAVSPSGTAAVVIEVKTTAQDSWVVGNSVPPAGDQLWAFVYLPVEDRHCPRYFILDGSELHAILAPDYARYRARFLERCGHEFSGTPVITLSRRKVEAFEGKWAKVLSRIHGA